MHGVIYRGGGGCLAIAQVSGGEGRYVPFQPDVNVPEFQVRHTGPIRRVIRSAGNL